MKRAAFALSLVAALVVLVGCPKLDKARALCDGFDAGVHRAEPVIADLDKVAATFPADWRARYDDAKSRLHAAREVVETACATVRAGGSGDAVTFGQAVADGAAAIIALLDLRPAPKSKARGVAAPAPEDTLRHDMESLRADATKFAGGSR